MREAHALELPEYFAALLRRRCAELGVRSDDVPAHPVGWQHAPRVAAMKRSSHPALRKLVRGSVRMELRSKMR